MTLNQRIGLLFLVGVVFLTGCQSSPFYSQTEDNIAQAKQRELDSNKKLSEYAKPVPPLVVSQGLYVDQTPISLAKQPSWLKNNIILRGEDLPFSYYSRTLMGGDKRNVLIHYQVGVNEKTTITMNYSGPLKGALDLLSAKTGYVYNVNNNDLYWLAFVTKTYDIAFMPGVSDYMMGKAAGGGGGKAAGASATGIIDDSASSQYSSLGGKISVWTDLEAAIKQMLSTDGKVVVSQATTSVTVSDRATNVDLITKYIANLNTNLSKQVLVKVQVLEVTLNSDYNYGINWGVVQGAFGGSNYKLNADYGTPITIKSLTGAAMPTMGLQAQEGRVTSFTMLVNALRQQGKVSVISEPRAVCLNNQVSAIRLIEQEGYLASIQSTTVPGSATGSATVTSQITPGSLVTGFTLYLLPKILDNKVYLQINADLSNKISIDQQSTGEGTNKQTIQTPHVTQKQFNQRSVIMSGDTLILSGFKRTQNQTGAMQLFESQALGGKAATQQNAETIVLITPIILHGLS